MAGFSINATVLKQNGRDLYCFAMNSTQLARISYVTPRSKDDPEEIQRILSVPLGERHWRIYQADEFSPAKCYYR